LHVTSNVEPSCDYPGSPMTMIVLQQILVVLLAAAGLFFMLVAAIGVLRLPDLFTRMHAATKASTLGISGIALAALVFFGEGTTTTRVLLIILFFFLTAPVGAHALGRAAYMGGVALMPETRRFDVKRTRIVCPIRGGPPSKVLLTKATQLAKESIGELIFLYVIPRDLVESAGEPGEAARVLAEMRSLGHGVVEAARTLAEASGVQAIGEVRMGDVQEEIIRLAQEVEATHVILGYPEMDRADMQHQAEERLWHMAETIRAEGLQVIMTR
jgi:multicomponent Na+:H+ antiporter subunit G